jgi:hypothetical protein
MRIEKGKLAIKLQRKEKELESLNNALSACRKEN